MHQEFGGGERQTNRQIYIYQRCALSNQVVISVSCPLLRLSNFTLNHPTITRTHPLAHTHTNCGCHGCSEITSCRCCRTPRRWFGRPSWHRNSTTSASSSAQTAVRLVVVVVGAGCGGGVLVAVVLGLFLNKQGNWFATRAVLWFRDELDCIFCYNRWCLLLLRWAAAAAAEQHICSTTDRMTTRVPTHSPPPLRFLTGCPVCCFLMTAIDPLLKHLLTLMNDKRAWTTRKAFFKAAMVCGRFRV